MVDHRGRPRHGRRHRKGRAGAGRSRCNRPQPRWVPTPAARPTTSSPSSWTYRAWRRRGGRAAVRTVRAIDVLVNNAASFYAGFFEELTPEQMERQLATSLIGPMNVTRAVLPVMRRQGSGPRRDDLLDRRVRRLRVRHGVCRIEVGVEGWMESLAAEVEPFGIHTTIVNSGFFWHWSCPPGSRRTTRRSRSPTTPMLNAAQRAFWEEPELRAERLRGQARLAARWTLAAEQPPPRRFIAGADAIAQAEFRAGRLPAGDRRPSRALEARSPTTTHASTA